LAACRTDDTGSNDETSETGETGPDADYTWWRDVEPIVTQKCSCHRASDIAPFSLAQHSESGAMPSLNPFVAPPGVGQRIEPGSLMIAQVHYNSAAGSTLADRTSIGLTLASSVERESVVLPLADIAWLAGNGAMSIPAGEANVTHEAYFTHEHPIVASLIGGLGLDPGAELEIANVGFHMHLFGKRGVLEVERADGSSECLVPMTSSTCSAGGTTAPRTSRSSTASRSSRPNATGARARSTRCAWGFCMCRPRTAELRHALGVQRITAG
jgi:hypothetical protein